MDYFDRLMQEDIHRAHAERENENLDINRQTLEFNKKRDRVLA